MRTDDGLVYEVTGSGPPILLIHEGIADRTMFDPQWESWSDSFTLIRYDQRGFGASADPVGEYTRHGDALTVLDAAGKDAAVVLGCSMGGEAALDLALAAPGRVSALVLVVATPSGWEPLPDLAEQFSKLDTIYEDGGLDAVNEAELAMWVDGPTRSPGDVDPKVREHVAQMNRSALEREEAAEQQGRNLEPSELDPPAIGRLGEVGVPTLVVTGALDQASVIAGAAKISAGLADAEAVEIPNTAHVPNLERPGEFDRAVLKFLSERLDRG
jgi:pimeloyl-ACP methyl ester carboxylesterase